jgi:hypothetical protein
VTRGPLTQAQKNAISVGARKAWADPERRAARIVAIQAAHDDPVHRAAMRERFKDRIRIGSRRERAGEYESETD